jgi:glucose-1-phosphate thymidylyltransferase
MNKLKGILAAGGSGSRLQPYTSRYKNKHLVPVSIDMPMIMAPLNTLKEFGCEEVLLITSTENCGAFIDLLKDGSEFGVKMTYKVQKEHDGILGAIKLGKNFVGKDERFITLLGDNYFEFDWSRADLRTIRDCSNFRIFAKYVEQNACDFGVVTDFGLKEKPKNVSSGLISTGCYILPSFIFEVIENFSLSERKEFEIVDALNYVLSTLKDIPVASSVYTLEENEYWQDCGTLEMLSQIRKRLFDKKLANMIK